MTCSGNYLLAGVHGLRASEVDTRLIERIKLELTRAPAFNEDINTVNGTPHGNSPYADYSGYLWLRGEIRRRLGHKGCSHSLRAKSSDFLVGLGRKGQ